MIYVKRVNLRVIVGMHSCDCMLQAQSTEQHKNNNRAVAGEPREAL